jgi:hypothetical protein
MKKIGIWIDLKEANIVTLDNEGTVQNYKTMYSEIETRERIPGESKKFGRFGEQYLNDEKTKKHKLDEQTNKYLLKVLDKIKDTEELMIFGPSQTKKKLEKIILKNPKLISALKEVKNADQMTDNQKKAYVRKYFGD